nr:hypothetical protein [Tanacetum cinerariifolium]
MSAKQTSWNEFSSAMASAVVCLSTGENVEEDIAEERVQDDDVVAAVQEGVTVAVVEDVQEPSIPSPTPPPQPHFPSISQVQSPLPQPQFPTPAQPPGADFPM